MKKGFSTLILIGFISLGFITACSGKANRYPAPVEVNQPTTSEKADAPADAETANQPAYTVTAHDILKAHNALRRRKDTSSYFAKAIKLTPVANPGPDMPASMEQEIEVFVKGNAFKRYREFPQEVVKEYHTFDGQSGYQLVIEKDKPEGGVSQMIDSELTNVEFGVRRFGLLFFLNQLADPKAEVVYLGRTAHQDDKIKVTTLTDSFIVYADPQHVIRRIETGSKKIEFWAYKYVGKILLPYVEKVYVKNQLSYELHFRTIRLRASFPHRYFTREAITENIAF
ncbi:MAG TPA: hypothetical protein VLR90_19940 [Blastocatellia bacterium]|nr:hypothetical protein [Blastocatellia bacterium]